jgi:hypothetical protein
MARIEIFSTTISTRTGLTYNRRAWAGGDTPPKGHKCPEFKALRAAFFRDYLSECGGLDLWECAGTSALDRARIFWGNSTLDAWRTLNP